MSVLSSVFFKRRSMLAVFSLLTYHLNSFPNTERASHPRENCDPATVCILSPFCWVASGHARHSGQPEGPGWARGPCWCFLDQAMSPARFQALTAAPPTELARCRGVGRACGCAPGPAGPVPSPPRPVPSPPPRCTGPAALTQQPDSASLSRPVSTDPWPLPPSAWVTLRPAKGRPGC